MKSIVISAALLLSNSVVAAPPPPGYCDVVVCNKLERFSLSPWSHFKDAMGEQCMPAVLGADDAREGKVLDSSSRWYQGTFNPTKRSTTRVKQVIRCTPTAKK